MTGDLIPVLWVCGPPGVGKSKVGWEIFIRLTHDGTKAGYVDIDQLGMCYPEQATDPGRHRMKTENLAAVVANYRTGGARCVIVAGVVDPGRGVLAGQPAGYLIRVAAAAAADAEALEHAALGAMRVDTDGLTAAETAEVIAARTGWPA